jgi:hypothetical protein
MSQHERYLGLLIALTTAWLVACSGHGPGPGPSSVFSVSITNWEGVQSLPRGWKVPLTAKASFLGGHAPVKRRRTLCRWGGTFADQPRDVQAPLL